MTLGQGKSSRRAHPDLVCTQLTGCHNEIQHFWYGICTGCLCLTQLFGAYIATAQVIWGNYCFWPKYGPSNRVDPSYTSQNFLRSYKKNKKNTPNWLKWRENWSEIIFGFVDMPWKRKFGKKRTKPKLLQIGWNGENFCQKSFLDFLTHPEKNLVKKEKNQSSFKLAKLARTLVGFKKK